MAVERLVKKCPRVELARRYLAEGRPVPPASGAAGHHGRGGELQRVRRAGARSYLPSVTPIHVHEPLPRRSRYTFATSSQARLRPDDGAANADDSRKSRASTTSRRRHYRAAVPIAINGPSRGHTAMGNAAARTAGRPITPPARSLDEIGVTPALGRDVLRRILYWRPAPHLLVVPEGIHRTLRRTQAVTIDVVQRNLGAAPLIDASQERLVDTPYAEPGTGTERTIAGLWESSLGVTLVGLDDGFFEMGGDSLGRGATRRPDARGTRGGAADRGALRPSHRPRHGRVRGRHAGWSRDRPAS